jgi:large subunit ribosomal protein L30
MLILIRISGIVNLTKKLSETLFRLRLRRKYSAVLFKQTSENMKILKKVRNNIAYGDIDEKTLYLLIEKRGLPKDKSIKVDPKKVIDQIEKLPPTKWDIKPFFRLHPARGGIDAKKHFGVTKKGVLGDNKKAINDLVRRML